MEGMRPSEARRVGGPPSTRARLSLSCFAPEPALSCSFLYDRGAIHSGKESCKELTNIGALFCRGDGAAYALLAWQHAVGRRA
jgi:hypothetical protein